VKDVAALAAEVAALRAALDESRRREARLRSFIDHSADAFIAHDMQGRFIDLNEALARSLGYTREQLLGMYVYDVEMTVKPGQVAGIWSRMTPGVPVTIEGRHRRADGVEVPVEVRIGLYGEGEGRMAMAICRDITERKRVERALRELNAELGAARDQALAASAAKSGFLANMSHELRTPLNAIIGYTELLAEEATAPEVRADLGKIQGAALHLLGVINDILDLSKIEANKLELSVDEFSVEGLIEGVMDVARPLAEARRNALAVELGEGLGVARSDPSRLRQALVNLLSNACKFTEDGAITLRASAVLVEGARWLSFAVEDTGIGIPEERLAAIWEAFTQADSSTSRRYGGTGLGLTLTRRFCRLLQGDVSVVSAAGAGSTFTILVPAEIEGIEGIEGSEAAVTRGGEEALPVASAPPAERGDLGDAPVVLVIDDDPAVHELIARLLIREGIRARSAYDGKEGLALALAYRPAVILLDLLLPSADGWDVLAAIKSEPSLAGVPVALCSVLHEQGRALSLGISDYLLKPIRREALLEVLRRHRVGPGVALVVDDDADVREVLRRTLEGAGWTVLAAADGREALAALASARAVDVIVLDLMMPEMDGFAVVEALRADPRWSSTPVIVSTAMALDEAERRYLSDRVQAIYRKGSMPLSTLAREVATLARRGALRR
jgi:PAS domain S-box-containing protein